MGKSGRLGISGLFLALIFLLLGSIQNTVAAISDSIATKYQLQLELYPQEKLYLQTDRPVYMQGDRIWFRVHQVDAATHCPVLLSRYVYAELIGSEDTVVTRVKLRPFENVFSGYIDVPKEASSGKYHVRAYTNYMRNWGSDYFFIREITVGTLGAGVKEEENTTTVFSKDYDVSFFPEGGDLPAGVLTHVGVKALNSDGRAEKVKGVLLDECGDTVTHFETIHAGMGVMGVQLEAGKKYVAECRNEERIVKRFSFPSAKQGICNIQARWMRDKLVVSLTKSDDLASVTEDYTLIIHSRSIVQYAGKWDNSHSVLLFEKHQFPSGVLQLLLLNERLESVSERLVFCRNEDQAEISFSTDRASYNVRDRIQSVVEVSDGKGNPLSGSFSVSVTDSKDLMPDTTLTIRSYLLLSSDLRGYIENPEFYFSCNLLSERALDCLMLTQGWRRYDNMKVLAGKPERPSEYQLELGQYIDGQVKELLLNRPVRKAKVTALAAKGAFVRDTVTDREGRFRLEGFEFPDSVRFLLTALTARGGDQVGIRVIPPNFPEVDKTKLQTNGGEILASYRRKAYQRYFNDSVMWNLQLGEVVIEADRKEKPSRNPFSGNGEWGDFVLKPDYIKRFKPSTMGDLLRLIPGCKVTDGSISLSRALGESPIILIDGFEGSLNSLNVLDVESVEVIYPPRSNIYGLNTQNGVIYILTKLYSDSENKPNKTSPNICELFPLGFQRPAEFYSPVYETKEQKASEVQDLRTTLYWNPNVILSEQGKAEFSFYTADEASSYTVLIEGVTSDGRTIYLRKDVKYGFA